MYAERNGWGFDELETMLQHTRLKDVGRLAELRACSVPIEAEPAPKATAPLTLILPPEWP